MTDAARIEELEAELFDLREFIKAERHFDNPLDETLFGDSELEKVRKELDDTKQMLQEKVEQFKAEHFELLQYRTGLLPDEDQGKENGTTASNGFDNQEQEERMEHLTAQLNLLEEMNEALEENAVKL